MLQDTVHCQMPGIFTIVGSILLQNMTHCGMSGACNPTGKIDSDQEALLASTDKTTDTVL